MVAGQGGSWIIVPASPPHLTNQGIPDGALSDTEIADQEKKHAARLPRLKAMRARRNAAARAKRQAYADLGMKRARGSLGGIYYE